MKVKSSRNTFPSEHLCDQSIPNHAFNAQVTS